MTFPITIVDNFFEDPDAIVEQALSHKYYNPDIGNYQVNVQSNFTPLITASSIILARSCFIYISIRHQRGGRYKRISKNSTIC